MIKHHLDYPPHLEQKIRELRREGIRFLIAVNIALARIWFLSLFPFEDWKFLSLPKVGALRRTGSLDLCELYQRVKAATIEMAAFYGEGETYVERIKIMM